ncbi:hypothetical protein HYT53_01215 [Candidatus Woesearchaeota archaeon]|nr:hypothetical protein [Candidatus Woesearchaeota archaeon]
MHKNEFVLWFEDIKKKDTVSVGGKAANLGELYSKFPIPDGFCITVKFFDDFLQSTDIKDKILELLKKLDAKKSENVDNISNKIKNLITKQAIPNNLRISILENYMKLGGFVAVRSSAVAEDLKQASFAGQQSSFLNVKGKNLIKYIKKCWASFYNSRAIIYREKNKFSHAPSMAVVIQKMVNAKKSGVIFTVNPVNKNKNEMIIESIFGLGEAIVSGIVTPDHYAIEKKNLKIVKEIINEKKIAILRTNGKNKTIKLDAKKANSKTLNFNELKQLAKEALKIEKHYKKSMDIEWAIDDKLYILQARPITTL